eukprot:2450093-Heterocapsa_arctica.AAC.1
MATRSTQQTIMVGDFTAMTGPNSSPHVRACLMTFKQLGAVYDIPSSSSGSSFDPWQVVDAIWPKMLTAGTEQLAGTVEDRANEACK